MAKRDKIISYYFSPEDGLMLIFLDGSSWKYRMTTEQFVECINQNAPLDAIFNKIRTSNLVGVKV